MVSNTLDLRPGGSFHFCLRSPDGHEMWAKWVFREIVAPERLVWIHSFSDAAGNLTRHSMSPDWPLEMLSTTTFSEHDGKTTIQLRWAAFNATEAERKIFSANHDSMRMGWSGTFEQLDAYLAQVLAKASIGDAR